MSSIPKFEELLPSEETLNTIDNIKTLAHKSAYNLLVLLNSLARRDKYLQVGTTESLTAGLIMSTLVDIPWGGYLKYGCFGVYDTDAKRVFNGVSVDDVYTHKCASEMAIGVLKNSNATLSIAVTGNAMPLNEHANMLGEIFIGIAGYDINNNIVYITKSLNACIETEEEDFKKTCKKWYKTIVYDKKYNPRSHTATVSQEIRNYTAYKAIQLCIDFVNKYNPIVPDIIIKRKQQNEIKDDISKVHLDIPKNKYEYGGDGICLNESFCDITGIRNDIHVSTYKNSINGGNLNKSKKLRKYKKRNIKKTCKK